MYEFQARVLAGHSLLSFGQHFLFCLNLIVLSKSSALTIVKMRQLIIRLMLLLTYVAEEEDQRSLPLSRASCLVFRSAVTLHQWRPKASNAWVRHGSF